MGANVLFVETEGDVLKKLQQNSEMQALNAETLYIRDSLAGTDIILQRNISVIIANFGSDLKNCHDFCLKVREQTPTFIMIVLLIDKQVDEVANEIKYAHQILALSCSAKEIVAAIVRGIQLANKVQHNSKLASLLSKLDSLPSPPTVYFDLREQLSLPSCNAGVLTQLILHDQALAAKILSVANSGFYAMPRTISNLRQAITLLGTETLLGLVLATHLFDSLPLPGLNLDNLWKHAIGIGLMARHIAKEKGSDREHVEASGIAGLLHDLGSLVFVSNQPGEYQAMLRSANGDETILIKMERESFGVDHAELGGLVLLLWGLPDIVVNAVTHHHDDDLQSTLVASSPTWAVMTAEWMFNFSGPLTAENKQEFINTCPFECSIEKFDHWHAILEEIQTKT